MNRTEKRAFLQHLQGLVALEEQRDKQTCHEAAGDRLAAPIRRGRISIEEENTDFAHTSESFQFVKLLKFTRRGADVDSAACQRAVASSPLPLRLSTLIQAFQKSQKFSGRVPSTTPDSKQSHTGDGCENKSQVPPNSYCQHGTIENSDEVGTSQEIQTSAT